MILPTLYGVLVVGDGPVRPERQDIYVPRGESGTGAIQLTLDDGTTKPDLTGGVLVISVNGLFSRQVTLDSAPTGLGHFPFATSDTFGGINGAAYNYDVLYIDVAGLYGAPGGWFNGCVASSLWTLSPTWATDPPTANPLPPQPVIGGSVLEVDRTISQPSDGDDFRVYFSTAQANANYSIINVALLTGGAFADFVTPNNPGDRTTASFRVTTTGTLDDGAKIACFVIPSAS